MLLRLDGYIYHRATKAVNISAGQVMFSCLRVKRWQWFMWWVSVHSSKNDVHSLYLCIIKKVSNSFYSDVFALKQMFHGHKSSLKLVCLVPGFKSLYLKVSWGVSRVNDGEIHFRNRRWMNESPHRVNVICCFRNIKSVGASNIPQNRIRRCETLQGLWVVKLLIIH